MFFLHENWSYLPSWLSWGFTTLEASLFFNFFHFPFLGADTSGWVVLFVLIVIYCYTDEDLVKTKQRVCCYNKALCILTSNWNIFIKRNFLFLWKSKRNCCNKIWGESSRIITLSMWIKLVKLQVLEGTIRASYSI